MNSKSSTFTVEHVVMSLEINFSQFIKNFDALSGQFDPGAIEVVPVDALRSTISKMEGEEGLMVFGKLDHGALFSMKNASVKALRYYIGNPIVAFSMTQHEIGAALYAPLSVLVLEDGDGTKIEFDRPSTLFGQFGLPAVTRIGLELDGKLGRLIEKAARD